MQLYTAKVADILRTTQRDEAFVSEAEEKFQTIFKLFGITNYNRTRTTIPIVTNVWYYLMTSLSNLQTLGEEYTGTIRIDSNNKIPSKLMQVIWIALYVGGEPLLDRLLHSCKTKVTKSHSLTNEAKSTLIICIEFLKQQRPTLKRIHHAIFYTNGKYYNISNRATNIRYVLVRQWLQDDSFTGSFNLLGNLSLFYIFFNLVQRFWSSHNSGDVCDNNSMTCVNLSNRSCVLCSENLKSASATPCGHIFCWSCIYESLQYQKVCPVCRRDIEPSRIVLLQNYH